MKKALLLMATCAVCSMSYAQLKVESNGDVKISNKENALTVTRTGRFAQALNFPFHTSLEGIMLENGVSESGGFFVNGDYAIIWSAGDYNRLLRIYDEDFMSPTSTTYEKAYIDGTGGYFKLSDERRKFNIKTIEGPIAKLMKIRGVDYSYLKTSEEEAKDKHYKKESGFIAQELEEVMPEVVDTDEHGNKFVNFDGILPYLLEAIKEQQKQIEELQEQVKALRGSGKK
jgi:membrane-bound inhibitor of C-type lysozyme